MPAHGQTRRFGNPRIRTGTVANIACGYDVLGFAISGAGPSVFALCEGGETVRKTGEAVAKGFSPLPPGDQVHISKINQQINPHGVHVIPSAK